MQAVLDHLRAGRLVSDSDFDRIYPQKIRDLSGSHWTPVEVVCEAVSWLAGVGVKRVLDVGAGVGKFCLVGATLEPEITFVGIEHRPHFVDIAREAARTLRLKNLTLLTGTIDAAPWSEVDGVYFYNPFGENYYGSDGCLDHTVELSRSRFQRDVSSSKRFLDAMRPGTRVVTYHGFGGEMPLDYVLVHATRHGFGDLEFWLKRHETRPRHVIPMHSAAEAS